jgi:hypothetical protein
MIPGKRLLGAGAAALAAVLCCAMARADGISLIKLQPSFAGDRLLAVPSPHGEVQSGLAVRVVVDYAHNPLVLRDAATQKSDGAIVSDQTVLHLGLSYRLWKVVTLDLDLPVAFQRGDQPEGGGARFGAPAGTALADVRIGARVAVLGRSKDAFQLGIGTLVWLPTGSRAAYSSDGVARGASFVVAGGKARYLVWSASVGPEFRARIAFGDYATGPSLRAGAGVGFLPGDGSFQVGPEVTGGVPLDSVQKHRVDAEILVGARQRFARRFTAGFAAGIGIAPGVGTPDFRSVLAVAYAPPGA